MALLTLEEEIQTIEETIRTARMRRALLDAHGGTRAAALKKRRRQSGEFQASLFGCDDEGGDDEAARAYDSAAPWTAEDFATANTLLAEEREIVHMYMTGHPLALYGPALRRHSAVAPDEVAVDPSGQPWEVCVGGLVRGLKEMTAKNPRPGAPARFAFFALEGWSRDIRCVCWGEAWEQLKGRRPKDGDFVAAFGYAEHDKKTTGDVLFVARDVKALTPQEAATAALADRGAVNGDGPNLRPRGGAGSAP